MTLGWWLATAFIAAMATIGAVLVLAFEQACEGTARLFVDACKALDRNGH